MREGVERQNALTCESWDDGHSPFICPLNGGDVLLLVTYTMPPPLLPLPCLSPGERDRSRGDAETHRHNSLVHNALAETQTQQFGI